MDLHLWWGYAAGVERDGLIQLAWDACNGASLRANASKLYQHTLHGPLLKHWRQLEPAIGLPRLMAGGKFVKVRPLLIFYASTTGSFEVYILPLIRHGFSASAPKRCNLSIKSAAMA